MNTVSTYTLKPEYIIKLERNKPRFNDWEKEFYAGVKRYNYTIRSAKQWNIIKKLLTK
jgi:hypothetical protein